MPFEFDLLGDPIPPGHGEPGRPQHVATAENVARVRMLLVSGLPVKRIAEEMGISQPSLRKHYFHSGKIRVDQAREMALAESRARVMLLLDRAAAGGNVSAMKGLLKAIDAEEVRLADQRASAGDKAKPAPAMTPGKKQAAEMAAAEAEADLAAAIGNRLN